MSFKIIFVSDLHGNERLYDKLVKFANKHELKAVVIGGDICPHAEGSIEEQVAKQKEFIEKVVIPKIGEIKKPVFLMMGNDDHRANMPVLEAEEKKGTFNLLHNKVHELHKYKIVGYSFVNELPFLNKDWEKMDTKDSKPLTRPEQDIRTVKKEPGTIEQDLQKLKKFSEPKKTIYVIHAPPFDTNLDMLLDKRHVGSKAVRSFIEEEQPLLTLHGHVHEAVIASGEFIEKIGSTICLNPGSDYLDNILDALLIELDTLHAEHEMI